MTHSLHISADAVQAGVGKVLTSQTFARSEKLRSFLAYVVEKEQGGSAQALKGYSIGVDVFGRPEEFDPSSDPLVRVQAGKLRKLLDRYYETEGMDDPVRIYIPTGGYVPQYQWNRRECPPPTSVLDRMPLDPLPEALENHRPRRSYVKFSTLVLAAVTALNLAVAAFNVDHFATTPTIAPIASTVARSATSTGLPRIVIDTTGPDGRSINLIGDTLREAGTREAAVEVMSSEDDRHNVEIMDQRLRFRIALKPGATPGNLEMSLVHETTGSVLYRVSYELTDDAPSGQLSAIALDLVANTMPVSGEIYRFAAQQGLSSELMQCMSLTELYNNTNARLAFINADACQRRLVPAQRKGGIYSNLRMLRDASRSTLRQTSA